jgi:hypothetical protein
MSNNSTEGLAVNAVKNSLLQTEGILSPYINENDKEPSWDGFVYLYKDKSEKKSGFIGRVPVQVKGHIVKYKSDKKIPERISGLADIADLQNYLRSGGAIYFVVQINSLNKADSRIFYDTLTPVKLKRYIEGAKSKGKKAIKLNAFPSENNKKIEIFRNFQEDNKKQSSFSTSELLTINDINKTAELTSFAFSVISCGNPQNMESLYQSICDNEVYLYANIKNSSVPHPFDFILKSVSIHEEENCIISVQGQEYYGSFTRIRKPEHTVIKIGNSVSIIIDKDKNAIVEIEFTTSLRKRAIDLSFVLAANKAGRFYIDDNKLDFAIPRKVDLKEQENSLDFYLKTIKLLDVLNVIIDLDIKELNESCVRNIDILYRAIVEKETVKDLKIDSSKVLNFRLGKVLLKFFVTKNENDYTIHDFFNSNNILRYFDLEDKEFVSSVFSVLKKEDYLKISNINYDAIAPSYKLLVDNDNFSFEQANLDMLEILLAFDESKNPRLLKVAKEMANWLLEVNNGLHFEIKRINYLQIIKREQELNMGEKQQLLEITESSTATEEIKVAAYLLLDNQDAAEIHFEKLDANRQNELRGYPIYNFWKKFRVANE